jgi:predicted dehydrogenase
MALTVAEAESVIAAATASGCLVIENFSYHLAPAYTALSRRFREIASIRIQFSFEATEDHRLRYNPALGGGSFLDLGCYGVDFVHRLLDCELAIEEVAAERPAAVRGNWGNVDETCVVKGKAAGVDVSITSSFSRAARRDFTIRFNGGGEQHFEREDDAAGMLQSFARMPSTDPADILRWRRNASVIEKVRALITKAL